jgi:hypothetical protein
MKYATNVMDTASPTPTSPWTRPSGRQRFPAQYAVEKALFGEPAMNAEAAEAYIRSQLDAMLVARKGESKPPAAPRILTAKVTPQVKAAIPPTEGRLRYSHKRVLLAVAVAHNVAVSAITGKQRDREIVAARHHCCWLLREKAKMSFPQIGEFLGYDEHSTTMHAVRKFQREIDKHTEINIRVERLLDGADQEIQP